MHILRNATVSMVKTLIHRGFHGLRARTQWTWTVMSGHQHVMTCSSVPDPAHLSTTRIETDWLELDMSGHVWACQLIG